MNQWQKIIWREWRHCPDIEYEERLFRVVADGRPGAGSRLTLIVLNATAGAALGLLVGFVFTLNWMILANTLWAGMMVGAAGGLLSGHRLTWKSWLGRLQANSPTGNAGGLIFSGLLLAVAGGMVFGPAAWLCIVGLFWAIGGLIHWLNNATDEAEEYRSGDRRWWFWWRKQPHLFDVEAALRQACQVSEQAQEIWAEPLRRLDAAKNKLASPESLISLLFSHDWVERFTASYRLVLLGEVAVPELQSIAATETHPLQATAQWLLHNINAHR